ncbi:DUF2953 domain-containing protein [Paenibacillus senegalensis]|uniref:DUF2953 domain-containing protein n=1 Tax=Paenibacillus senegalensis TaxID=1465766 RepID=UPI0002881D04|nr:DUF2953 domain-containing protein [Paenibacillus senegalensis]
MVLILASFVHINLYINRVQDQDQISIQIKALFGWIQYRYDIPLIRFVSLAEGIQLKTEENNKNMPLPDKDKAAKITWDKVARSFDQSMRIFHQFYGSLHWLKQTLRKLQVTEFNWYTRVGMGEAPETAVLSGMIWAVKGTISGWMLHHVMMMKTPQLAVVPMYNRTLFSTELACITKIRTGNAIIAGLQLLARKRLVKGGFKRWQIIRFKG